MDIFHATMDVHILLGYIDFRKNLMWRTTSDQNICVLLTSRIIFDSTVYDLY